MSNGHCSGCGRRVKLWGWEKHGEPGRFCIDKCRCGSTTGQVSKPAGVGYVNRPHCFKRADKSLRRLRALVRSLKEGVACLTP